MRNAHNASVLSWASATVTADVQILTRLAEIADQLSERSIASDARQLATRIEEGRFFVACVGQFKRGKSTLLNALIGEDILPTGVTPVTAVPTVLRYGNTKAARVLVDTQWRSIQLRDIPEYVSEELNPQNAKQVDGIEVFVPSPLLASGMCLVDTPGIGSVFSANSEATRDFIPQSDAAILVVGADPPISGEELALIQAVAANVDEILIVLNKIDRVSEAERQEASAFASRVLKERLKKPVGKIYEVSALNRLSRSIDTDDWNELAQELTRRAAQAGQAITSAAAARGVARFSVSLQHAIAERIRALQEPIAESEERIAGLHQTASEAEQSLRDLGSLFSAEQMRLSNELLARRKEFLRRAVPVACQDLLHECQSIRTAFGPARRREMMAKAQTVARRHVMPWLEMEEAHGEELYVAVTQRFVNQVNNLVRDLADRQPGQYSHLFRQLDMQQGFGIRSRFYFHEMVTVAKPASPLIYIGDVLQGAVRVSYFFQKAASEVLVELLDTNTSRIQGDVEQRVVESRTLLESQVRKLLREVSATAGQALASAKVLLESGNAAIQSEVKRLSDLQKEI